MDGSEDFISTYLCIIIQSNFTNKICEIIYIELWCMRV